MSPERSAVSASLDEERDIHLTRADFAVLVRRNGARRNGLATTASVLSGLLLAWGGISLAERVGWPTSVGWVMLALGWAVSLGALSVTRRRILRQDGLSCPACSAPLTNVILPRKRELRVMESGVCPACAHALFPSEP